MKNTNLNGPEDFNVQVVAPFKLQDFVVGFRYALGNFRRTPESFFAKRSFETPGEGVATVHADYTVADNNLNVAAQWSSDKLGVTVIADGDVQSRLKSVGAVKTLSVNSNRFTFSAAYDVLQKKLAAVVNAKADANGVNLSFDTASQNPVLTVSREIDENNEVAPTISLKTGELSYGYKRKWTGGSLLAKLLPGDKLSLTWKDHGANGAWTTQADIPFDDASKSKVSFSHEWDY